MKCSKSFRGRLTRMDYEMMHTAIKVLDRRSKQMDDELCHKYGVGPAYSSNKQVHGIGPAIDAKLAREIAQYTMDCIDQEVKKLSRDNGVANIIRERSSGKIKYNHGDWRDDEQAYATDRMMHSIIEKIKNTVENKVQSRYGMTTTDLYRYGFGNNKRFDNDNVLRDISSIIHEKINEHVGISHSAIMHTAIRIMNKREILKNDELCHYGRKGMKWNQDIFADEEERMRRAGAQNEETGAQRAARLKKELLLRRANKAAEQQNGFSEYSQKNRGDERKKTEYAREINLSPNREIYNGEESHGVATYDNYLRNDGDSRLPKGSLNDKYVRQKTIADYNREKYGGIGKGSDYVNKQQTANQYAEKYSGVGKGSDYANSKMNEQMEKEKQRELISKGLSKLPDYKKIAEDREAREQEEENKKRNNKIKDANEKLEAFNENPFVKMANPVGYQMYKEVRNKSR